MQHPRRGQPLELRISRAFDRRHPRALSGQPTQDAHTIASAESPSPRSSPNRSQTSANRHELRRRPPSSAGPLPFSGLLGLPPRAGPECPLSEPIDPTERGHDLARDQLRDSLDRRPASSRSRAPILPGRAIWVVRRESLSATLSPVVHSIPQDDWVSAEAEALLDATPGLREDLRAAMDELHAGTLQAVDAATARARIEARIKSRGSS
jgi:hypothetical protein